MRSISVTHFYVRFFFLYEYLLKILQVASILLFSQPFPDLQAEHSLKRFLYSLLFVISEMANSMYRIATFYFCSFQVKQDGNAYNAY